MILLALDTAAGLCAASVFDTAEGAERGRAVLDLGKGHAEHVMAVIAEALAAAGLSYGDLQAIGVSVGPGSFTGVRVGVAAARGLALALKIPVAGVTTLAALAYETRQLFPARTVLAAIGTRPDNLYAAVFDAQGTLRAGPVAAPLAEIAAMASDGMALCGSAGRFVAEAAGMSAPPLGRLAATADIDAYARLAAAGRWDGERPRPLYLRAPDARPQSGLPPAGRS